MKITTRTTIAAIREQLVADGFNPDHASAVKRAALKGCLVWTRSKLITTDASRISLVSTMGER